MLKQMAKYRCAKIFTESKEAAEEVHKAYPMGLTELKSMTIGNVTKIMS